MNKIFTDPAWEDYLYWQQENKKFVKKINDLLQDIERHPFSGIGKPEALRHELSGCWSRRIDREHRLVYEIKGDELWILTCRYHY